LFSSTTGKATSAVGAHIANEGENRPLADHLFHGFCAALGLITIVQCQELELATVDAARRLIDVLEIGFDAGLHIASQLLGGTGKRRADP
jgi:hypothetical protein